MPDIPGYSIQHVIGSGGMANVYLAVQESLGRQVALKVLLPGQARDAVATERFLREARYAAQLHHPNIVAIHDVGVHDGTPYMAMAYEPGGTIAQTNQGQSDPVFVLRAIRDIALALDYAHRKGVVHRDVKPENILRRNDGTCVLSDFGIAHALSMQTGLTNEGNSVGTPHYMSPEQLRGEKVDGRADLYSLGVVFYQTLVGDLPYHGTDGWAIGMQHISAPIPRLPVALSRLQPILDALLAKDPDQRPQSGAELVERIDALLAAGGLETVGDVAPMNSAKPRRSAWIVALPVGLIVMATVMLVVRSGKELTHRNASTAIDLAASGVAPDTATSTPVAGMPSIAVLPFVDMSERKDQEYFSDGLSEELISALARTPGLRVAGRTSAFSFKGKGEELKTIGAKLGVQSLLEGSVRTSGTRVRITAQLVNASDGFQLWSETYDRELTDVYAVQDEIAKSVVSALQVRLLGKAPSASGAARSTNPEAYAQYLRARQMKVRSSPATAQEGVAAFGKVIALDPGFAPAYAHMAMAQSWAADYAETEASMAEGQRAALATADRAVAIDPAGADGYWARGNLRASLSWDWNGAHDDLHRALELKPGDSLILQANGSLLASLGKLDEAITLTGRAAELDPLQSSVWQALGYFQEANGDFDSARQSQERAIVLKPRFPFAHFRLGAIALQQGQLPLARKSFDDTGYEPLQLLGTALVEHTAGKDAASLVALDALVKAYGFNAAYQVAQAHAWRGESDKAFLWLERAFEQRDGGLGEVKYDPLLRSLRSDARYASFLSKMKLPR